MLDMQRGEKASAECCEKHSKSGDGDSMRGGAPSSILDAITLSMWSRPAVAEHGDERPSTAPCKSQGVSDGVSASFALILREVPCQTASKPSWCAREDAARLPRLGAVSRALQGSRPKSTEMRKKKAPDAASPAMK